MFTVDKIKWSLTNKFDVDDCIKNVIGTSQLVIAYTIYYYTYLFQRVVYI